MSLAVPLPPHEGQYVIALDLLADPGRTSPGSALEILFTETKLERAPSLDDNPRGQEQDSLASLAGQ